MDCVMTLQQITNFSIRQISILNMNKNLPAREGHMACHTFEWFDICVSQNMTLYEKDISSFDL
jgi:hypothetical protein